MSGPEPAAAPEPGPPAAPEPAPALAAREVSVQIGPETLVDKVSLDVAPGEFVALVGPNGAGKSTLAAVLAGDRRPDHGEVHLLGSPLGALSHRQTAHRRAVLPQDSRVAFPFRAEQVVMMGRYPHLPRGRLPTAADWDVVANAMAFTDTTHLVGRPMPTLSGGEHARVCLARVLAQEAPVVILDEPTTALDLQHQQQVLKLCRDLAADGRAVLIIIHDLNHASAADRVAVLHRGQLVEVGSPDEVLTPATVAAVFAVEVTVVRHPTDRRPVILPHQPT